MDNKSPSDKAELKKTKQETTLSCPQLHTSKTNISVPYKVTTCYNRNVKEIIEGKLKHFTERSVVQGITCIM